MVSAGVSRSADAASARAAMVGAMARVRSNSSWVAYGVALVPFDGWVTGSPRHAVHARRGFLPESAAESGCCMRRTARWQASVPPRANQLVRSGLVARSIARAVAVRAQRDALFRLGSFPRRW